VTGGPLSGVRVIDLSSVVVGPICTRSLADQGADVVKVEAPQGDLLRTLATGRRSAAMSGKFIHFNRNKRSVCLDLKQPAAMAALHALLVNGDVFVSNMRMDALERLGLDAQTLMAKYPRLIHCSILSFGREGRYFNAPAYDGIVQSASGVASTLERATGEPRFVPMVMADHISGLIAAQCIGFALYRRTQTGLGEAIDVPMFENMASFVMSEHMGAATFEPAVGPYGDERLLSPDYRPLPTRDGYVTVTANTDAQAFGFFQAIGRPELRDDPRFSSVSARTAHTKEYFALRTQALREKTTDEWLRIFAELDIPSMRYNRLEDLRSDPHLADVGFFEKEEHESEGTLWRTRVVNRFSGGMRQAQRGAPRLGQHTREVLSEIGYSQAQIDELVAAKAAIESEKPRTDGDKK
jgi:crotonobetainyl-CoA:carnitine CoA-transferase CaiB-like acyl-CoA transferase